MATPTAKFQISATDKTAGALRKVKQGLRDLGDTAKKLGIAAAAAAAGIGVIIAKNNELIDRLAKMSATLGISIGALENLRRAATLSGASSAVLDKSLQKLGVSVTEASEGMGEAVDSFEALGLNAQELARLSLDQQFAIIADAIKEVDNQAQRIDIAKSIFGRGGVELLNTLEIGSAGLEKMAERTAELGLVLSRVDAKAIEAANDAIGDLARAGRGLANVMSVSTAPALQLLGTAATDAVIGLRSTEGSVADTQAAITQFVIEIIISAKAVVDVFNVIQKATVGVWRGITKGIVDLNLIAVEQINKLVQSMGGAGRDLTGLRESQVTANEKWADSYVGVIDAIEETLEGGIRLRAELAAVASEQREARIAEALAQEERILALREGIGAPGGDADTAEEEAAREKAELKAERERTEITARIERIREGLLTEEELERERFVTRMTTLAEAFDAELITRGEHQLRIEQLTDEHEQRLASKRIAAERRANKTIFAMKITLANQGIGLLQALAGESRTAAIAAIVLQKGLAIAETIMNTQVAAMRAIAELGPIAGIPVAAAIQALGAISVGIIAAQGLSQAAAVGAGGASIGTVANPAIVQTNQEAFSPAPVQSQAPVIVNITIEGTPTAEQVIDLIDVINEAVGDGVELIATPA